MQHVIKYFFRRISYMEQSAELRLTSFLGDELKNCKVALYSDASFADDLAKSKSTTGCYLTLVGPNTCCPLTWMCKKQGAVSHSSTEAEIIALDTVVRMEGLPALNFMDCLLGVLHPLAGPEANGGKGKGKHASQLSPRD